MGEMDNLTLSGGRRKQSAPRRTDGIGAMDRRQRLRTSLRRSRRNLMRRIRRRPGQEDNDGEGDKNESLMTKSQETENGCDDPYAEMYYNQNQSSKPVNELDSDDNDDFDFIDKNYGEDNTKEEEKEEASVHDDDEQKDDNVHGKKGNHDHSDFEESDLDKDENDHHNDGHWGRYDDEYGHSLDGNSVAGSKDSLQDDHEEHTGVAQPYRDGEDFSDTPGAEHRQDHGSPRNNGRRRSSLGRRGSLLKQLSEKVLRRKSKTSTPSNLDHTNLVTSNSGDDPYYSPKSPAKGRIEGFGSTSPDFTSPRTLRQKLKDFREHRIARNKDKEDGMKQMEVGDNDPKKKNWKERIENVVDAMVDASITEPEAQGYMTSKSLSVPQTTNTTNGSATPTNTPMSTKDASKMSYLRKQFGDDNAYIVYLEGEKVAGELEILSHQNRIKELEAETRRLKGEEEKGDGDGPVGDGDAYSVASDSSHVGEGGEDTKESVIKCQTGVPKEGVFIDLAAAPSYNQQTGAPVPTGDLLHNEQNASAVPATDLLQNEESGTSTLSWPLKLPLTEEEVEETKPQTDTISKTGKPLPTPPMEQNQELPDNFATETTSAPEETKGDLVDLAARDEAKNIVDGILAGVLSERKETTDVGDSLLTLKVEPAAVPESDVDNVIAPNGQEATICTSVDLLPEPPVDAPPLPPMEPPPVSPANAPPLPPESESADTFEDLKASSPVVDVSIKSHGTTSTVGTEGEATELKLAGITENPMSAEVPALPPPAPTVESEKTIWT